MRAVHRPSGGVERRGVEARGDGRAAHGACALSDSVQQSAEEGHLAGDEQAEGDCWVEVPSGERSHAVDEGEDEEAWGRRWRKG